MKKLMVLLSIALLVVSVSNAQSTSQKAKTEKPAKQEKLTPEQRAQRNVEELDKVVSLTADQKTKVSSLALDKVKKAEAIRSKYKGQKENKEAMKSEIESVRKEFRQNVKSLLTPEQLEKLKAKNKELKAQKNATKQDVLDGND
jgi:protein CpxP